MNNELQRIEPSAVAVPEPTTASLLQSVITAGITSDNVAAFKELVQLKREEDAIRAKRDFAQAFVSLQTELPTIQGMRQVPDKNGNSKFAYANFDDIDEIVRPICLKHGFTYSFHESALNEGRVTMVMTLQHSGGHYREIPYSCRIGSGPPGATESQADVSGHSYAKRGAIESGLSLRIVGKREDVKDEGSPISPEQADELERRLNLINGNREKFLEMAGAKSFKEILSSKFGILDQALKRRENAGR